MEQHPVPQHIASFQFKLFGNLTIRQFMILAGPMTLAVLVFFSNLPPLIKMPLAGVIGFVAIFVALVPVGGRPFDKWFVAFVKAVFSPTQRVWIKEKKMPEFLNVVVVPQQTDEKIPEEITEQGRERLIAYLKSLPKENESVLDVREDAAISRLGLSVENAGVGSVPPPIIWPNAQIDNTTGIRKSSLPNVAVGTHNTQIKKFSEKVLEVEKPADTFPVKVMPKISNHAKPFVIKGLDDRIGKLETPPPVYKAAPLTHLASDTNFSVDNIISVKEPDNKIRLVRGVGQVRVRKLHFGPPANFDLSKLPVRGERRFEISDELARRFHFEDESPEVVLPDDAKTTVSSVSVPVTNLGSDVSRSLPKQVKQETVRANTVKQPPVMTPPVAVHVEPKVEPKFSVSDKKKVENPQGTNSAAQIIPLTSTPNVISGLVTDSSGVPIEGAVLVVRDTSGIPVRALKTSKLGQFLSSTPLSNGDYTIEVESDKAAFLPISMNLKGEILPPIGISGKVKN